MRRSPSGTAELTRRDRVPTTTRSRNCRALPRISGEHPDWAEYRQAMVYDKRLVRLHVERLYGQVPHCGSMSTRRTLEDVVAERAVRRGHARRRSRPALTDFRRGYPFALDPFQVRRCEALEDGHWRAGRARRPAPARRWSASSRCTSRSRPGRSASTRRRSRRCRTRSSTTSSSGYGADQVGLLTGDNAINGDAPVVVMTTEVLRNMLYAGIAALTGLAYVVMDEVHYLADRFRGAVWEEVIIHLPAAVRLVSLSATVRNAEEFGEWLVDGARRHRR